LDVQAFFRYHPVSQRIVFGEDVLSEVPIEVASFGNAFVVSGPHHLELADELGRLLGDHQVGAFLEAAPHTPVEVTEEALAALDASGAECLVSVGGGSATGLAKALALRRRVPIVAVPTTYAGSEMTPILGQTDKAHKWTLRDEVVRPRAVVFDVALTASMPARLAAASGCNALAHAVETLWARDASPVHLLMAEEAVRVLARALPVVASRASEPAERAEARSAALYGAFLAGTCLGSCEMALHHRLCHLLGGRFALAHAETHAIVLPQVVAFYGAGQAEERLCRALGTPPGSAALVLFDLVRGLGLPLGLAAIGLPPEISDEVADQLVEAGGYSPARLETARVRDLLDRAARGVAPGSAGGQAGGRVG